MEAEMLHSSPDQWSVDSKCESIFNQCPVVSYETDEAFDRITALAARVFKTTMALITFMDGKKHWFKSRLNIEFTEAPRPVAFCSLCYLNKSSVIFVIKDTHTTEKYANHPHVTGYPFARFYAGASIFFQDIKVGVLCVIDHQPHPDLSNEQQENLIDLAKCVTDLIQLRQREMFGATCHCVPLHQGVLSIIHEPLIRAILSKEWIADILKQIESAKSHGSFMEHIIQLNAAVDAFSNDMRILDTSICTETQILNHLSEINIANPLVAFNQNKGFMMVIRTEKWWEVLLQIFSFFKIAHVTPVCYITSELIQTQSDLLFLSFGALLGYLTSFCSISTIEVDYKVPEIVFPEMQLLENSSPPFHEGVLQVDVSYEEIDMQRCATSPQCSPHEIIQSLHHVLQWVQGYLTHDSIYRHYQINMPCKLIPNHP